MKYSLVNWIDGMKINKDHFIDEQKAVTNYFSEVNALNINEYNFGLVYSPDFTREGSIKLWIDLENDNAVHVKLARCIAVTYSGIKIIINEHTSPLNITVPPSGLIEKMNTLVEGEYFIALSSDPYNRIAFGDINTEEEPPRFPYTSPEYKIHLITVTRQSVEHTDPNLIYIGRVKLVNGGLQVMDNFIPPCRSINCHTTLSDIHADLNNQLGKLEVTCLHIIQKILQKDQQYPLAQLVQVISEHILYFLNSQMFHFRWLLKSKPPIEMVNVLSQLGRTIKNTIDVYQGTGKDELLNYFVDWCDLNQAQFEGVLSEVVNLEYKHNDIRGATDRCQRFLKEVVTLFQKLSELEYIGRKTEKTILVKEEAIKKENPPKTRISFFER